MLNKLLVAAAAAAAISVPLAGVAMAGPPSDPGSVDGVGVGGVPRQIGDRFGSTDPIPAGHRIRVYAQEGGSVPDAVGQSPTNPYEKRVGPGLVIRGFTPAGLVQSELP